MYGEVRGRTSLALVLGIGIFSVASAQAADLGGDCCGDLEERIAELEATTARKGNRKVSLEVSGQVNEAVLWWDDGVESNAGVYTNDNSRTRFRFKGDAKIADGWKAGFLLEVGIRSANSKRFDQVDVNGCIAPVPPQTTQSVACGLDLRHSVWYIDSKKFGRLWVGLTGGAGESVTEVNLAATKDILKYSDIEDTGLGLFTRSGGLELANRSSTGGRTGLEWRQLIRGGGDQPGEGRRFNMIRYDTPEMFGFKGIVDFGEDDLWEAGLRYEGEFNGIKLAAAIAYGENTEGPIDAFNADPQPGFQCLGNSLNGAAFGAPGIPDTKCSQLGGSISVMHVESGVYGNFAAGYMKDDAINSDPGFQGIQQGNIPDDRSEFYAFEVGVERKWAHLEHLGKTTLFAQYYRNEGGSQDRTVTTVTPGCPWNAVADINPGDFCNGFENGDIESSTLESYGLGVIQGIDKAAMHVYVVYRHYEGDILTTGVAGNGFAGTKFELDDLDVAMSGAIIKF